MEQPRVITEDGGLVVVDKPSGWVVHATQVDEAHDLQAWLNTEGYAGASPVHRLDRGASGVVLYSRDHVERGIIGRQLAAGEVHKRYLALVVGRTHRKGIIRGALDGKEAVTRYGLAEGLGAFSLLRVRPETGRRHQIRRHLHGLGFPIVGDDRYRSPRFRAVPGFPGRLFLHAVHLKLPDGRSFDAPLPEALESCLVALRGSGPPTPDP